MDAFRARDGRELGCSLRTKSGAVNGFGSTSAWGRCRLVARAPSAGVGWQVAANQERIARSGTLDLVQRFKKPRPEQFFFVNLKKMD